MSSPGKSPQPPLLFLGCLLMGLALGHIHPLAMGLPPALRVSLGALLLLVAGIHGGWGLQVFRLKGTTHRPNGVPSALLTSGPFRWTRNPLYLGLCTLLAGIGVLLNSAWMLWLVPVLILLLDRLVIAREEVRLQARFGNDYVAYTKRVRRWL